MLNFKIYGLQNTAVVKSNIKGKNLNAWQVKVRRKLIIGGILIAARYRIKASFKSSSRYYQISWY